MTASSCASPTTPRSRSARASCTRAEEGRQEVWRFRPRPVPSPKFRIRPRAPAAPSFNPNHMLKRNLWKIVLCCAIVAWAVARSSPQDRALPGLRQVASARRATGGVREAHDEASERGKSPSRAQRLRRAEADRQVSAKSTSRSSSRSSEARESSLRNIEKRNDILLDPTCSSVEGPLQLGLDLKGGVAFTLEVDEARRERRRPSSARRSCQGHRDHRRPHQRLRRGRADHPPRRRQPDRGPAAGRQHQGQPRGVDQ
jgi:hypothetical protein